MPNLKIYVEQTLDAEHRAGLAATLPGLREVLCSHLGVPHAACQLAIVTIVGLADQPRANAELFILPREDRTKEVRESLGAELQSRIGAVLETQTAVRICLLDAASYIALK
jgi:hypothetical protein